MKTGATLHGALHLVDLAGSERVDRSFVTGNRLKEAQHINKSLSALGDVVFSLSQKNAHVPYRNSKLTQVLQSSLGAYGLPLLIVLYTCYMLSVTHLIVFICRRPCKNLDVCADQPRCLILFGDFKYFEVC